MPPGDRITETTLLCERCGYVLEGLAPHGKCPECGQPIAESLPAARTGTPWQTEPRWSGFAAHCAMLARRPSTLFRRMRIDDPADFSLITASVFACSALATLPIARAGLTQVQDPGEVLLVLLLAASAFIMACVLLATLTWIERVGVVFFSRKRGWRVERDVARAVCANASPAWFAAVLLLIAGILLVQPATAAASHLPAAWRHAATAAASGLPLLGFVLGMLVFETLVYLGVRQCRFANRPK